MKKFSMIALIVVLAMVFTGCTTSEKEFLKAYKKTMDINSMESEITFNLGLEGEGFSPEQQLAVDQMASVLSNFQINMIQKMTQNKDKTASKAFGQVEMNMGGMIVPMSVWVDVDMSSESPKLVEYIKMPQMIMGSIYPEKPALEYIVYDFSKLSGEEGQQFNFNKLMELSKEMQPKIMELIDNYMNNFDLNMELIKNKGKRDVNGETLSIYELKLDDAQFKELLTSTVNYSLETKEMLNFIKEYMKFVASITEVTQDGQQLSQEEVIAEIDNLEKEIPQVKAKFNEFMDSIKDIKIIGDNGIVIEYGINKDGYIVYEAGSIDLRLDLEALSKLAKANREPVEGSVVEPIKGILKLRLNYSSKIKNINKDIEILMPEVNEENSIDFIDLMNVNEPVPAPEPTVGVIGGADGPTEIYVDSTLNK